MSMTYTQAFSIVQSLEHMQKVQERMQKAQEYDILYQWALHLSSHDRQYRSEVQTRMDRLASLQQELWPDA